MAPRGVYVARSRDRSAAVVFSSEIQALRHAVTHGLEVALVPFGSDVFDGDTTERTT